MSVTKKELRQVIKAALDCQSHFFKPTIINNDPDFNFGDGSQVICAQCVARMKKILDKER